LGGSNPGNNLDLVKSGSGTFTISKGDGNTYTLGTTINGGTLLVNNTTGSGTGTGDVTVNSGGTLGGTGSIAGNVTVNAGGGIAPGASVGTLTVSGVLTLSAGSTNVFEVNGSTPTNDAVVLGATVTYGGVLRIVPTGTFTNGQTFTLFSGAGATDPSNFASIQSPSGVFSFANGVLTVVTAPVTGPSGPATLTNSFNGTILSLSWPTNQGWRLLQQTNALSVGLRTNWVDVTPGNASSTNITVDKTKPTTFYRLVYP
jgi:autotransporter-associated beta strand protein